MNKITYFRKGVIEQYKKANLANAAQAGEALLREHWNNQVSCGIPYADDLFNLALVYDEMGVWERALEMYAESARLVHEEEGDSISFVSRVSNMAALLSRLGRAEHAYRLFAHMASLLRMSLHPKHPALADCLYNLANASADVGKKKDAQRLHEEALEIRKEAGVYHDAVHSLHSLAFLHEEENDDKSLHYAKHAVELAQETLEGPDIPTHEVGKREQNYYSACYYLASLHENRGELINAESLYENVLEWAKIHGGNGHAAYLNVASRLANILTNRGKYPEALTIYRDVSESFKHMVGITGDPHLFYANNLRSMAMLHMKINEHDEAERLLLEAIRIKRVAVDDITEDAILLIDLYIKNDMPEKALEMLVYVLMHVNTETPGYDEMLTTLSESFARAGNVHLAMFSAAMEELCQRDKVQAVIQKWNQWEKG